MIDSKPSPRQVGPYERHYALNEKQDRSDGLKQIWVHVLHQALLDAQMCEKRALENWQMNEYKTEQELFINRYKESAKMRRARTEKGRKAVAEEFERKRNKWLSNKDYRRRYFTTILMEVARIREQARRWILVPNQDFNDVCHMAGVDPSYTRGKMKSLIESS